MSRCERKFLPIFGVGDVNGMVLLDSVGVAQARVAIELPANLLIGR